MYRIFLAAVDIVPAAVILIPLFGVFYFTAFGRNFKKCVLYCLFCLYMAAIFSLVGIPNVTYFRPQINLNLIPFRGMVEDWKNGILNVALFVPLGFFLPMLWQKYRSIRSCAMFGFFLSLIIELLQMLTFRATDVNDLITNCLGAVIGLLLVRAITNRVRPVCGERRDVYFLCILSFAVMFFGHPFLSPLIWDSIL